MIQKRNLADEPFKAPEQEFVERSPESVSEWRKAVEECMPHRRRGVREHRDVVEDEERVQCSGMESQTQDERGDKDGRDPAACGPPRHRRTFPSRTFRRWIQIRIPQDSTKF